jgi:hypothetical protein
VLNSEVTLTSTQKLTVTELSIFPPFKASCSSESVYHHALSRRPQLRSLLPLQSTTTIDSVSSMMSVFRTKETVTISDRIIFSVSFSTAVSKDSTNNYGFQSAKLSFMRCCMSRSVWNGSPSLRKYFNRHLWAEGLWRGGWGGPG